MRERAYVWYAICHTFEILILPGPGILQYIYTNNSHSHTHPQLSHSNWNWCARMWVRCGLLNGLHLKAIAGQFWAMKRKNMNRITINVIAIIKRSKKEQLCVCVCLCAFQVLTVFSIWKWVFGYWTMYVSYTMCVLFFCFILVLGGKNIYKYTIHIHTHTHECLITWI